MRIEWVDRKLQLIKNELGLGPVLGLIALLLAAAAFLFAVLWFVDSAPPSTITLIGGPPRACFNAMPKNTAQYWHAMGSV